MANDRNEQGPRTWSGLLGEFRVQRELARGPYGTALVVRMIGDPERRGEMVLKVLHPVEGAAWKATERMDAAVFEAAAARPHPNLAKTYEKGQILDDVYVLQEKIDGVDLRTLLTLFPQPLGELSLRCKLGIAVQVAAALEHLHSIRLEDGGKTRLLHGDLHPGDVMIGADGVVRVLDVGYAPMARMAIRPAAENAAIGSPGFLAPEQLTQRRATPSTDVFAFGSLLGELLLGDPLFGGGTTVEILERSRDAVLGDALARIEAIHPGSAQLVQRCVTPSRKGRLSDGILLVGEMFARGMTDDAREPLAELVGRALEVRDSWMALPPRDLVADDGSLVDLAGGEDGLRDSQLDAISLGEPSVDSGTYPSTGGEAAVDADDEPAPPAVPPATATPTPAEPVTAPEPVLASDAQPAPVEDAEPAPATDAEPAPPPPVVEADPDLEETAPLEAVQPEAPVVDGGKAPPPQPPAPKAPPHAAAKASPAAAPGKTPASKHKKGGGLLWIGIAALLLVLCGGGIAGAYFGVVLPQQRAAEAAFDDVFTPPMESPETPTPSDDLLASADDDDSAGDDDDSAEGAAADALADAEIDEEIDEEPPPEPVEMTPEERAAWEEEQQRRREEQEERRRQQEEERRRKEQEERENDAAAAAEDWEPDFGDPDDEDEDWLNDDDDDGPSGDDDDKIDIDIDALTRDLPTTSVGTELSTRHTPIRSGKVGQAVTLRLTVTPSDDYTGVIYYRGAPNGAWQSQSISGSAGRVTVRLQLGSWIGDDHERVEYYFLVDGSDGSTGGAGTRLSPYSFVLR